MTDCIFCKIISKDIQANIIYEDDLAIAFVDLQPKAKFHYLLIPKKHIATMNDVSAEAELLGNLFAIVPKIATQQGFAEYGYSLRVHCNDGGGQEVYHLHIHILSNCPTEQLDV